MAARGGKRPGAGRRPGSPNKATTSIREAFAGHKDDLVSKLLELTQSEDLRVRMKAIEVALAYGFGKPSQTLHTDTDSTIVVKWED